MVFPVNAFWENILALWTHDIKPIYHIMWIVRFIFLVVVEILKLRKQMC
jgi:hypothetical protein